jgi:hypothetical protein
MTPDTLSKRKHPVFSIMTLTSIHQYIDAYAPEEGQADVLLCAIPQLSHFEGLLSGCQIQQKQHCAARQMVQQLPVSCYFSTFINLSKLNFLCFGIILFFLFIY